MTWQFSPQQDLFETGLSHRSRCQALKLRKLLRKGKLKSVSEFSRINSSAHLTLGGQTRPQVQGLRPCMHQPQRQCPHSLCVVLGHRHMRRHYTVRVDSVQPCLLRFGGRHRFSAAAVIFQKGRHHPCKVVGCQSRQRQHSPCEDCTGAAAYFTRKALHLIGMGCQQRTKGKSHGHEEIHVPKRKLQHAVHADGHDHQPSPTDSKGHFLTPRAPCDEQPDNGSKDQKGPSKTEFGEQMQYQVVRVVRDLGTRSRSTLP